MTILLLGGAQSQTSLAIVTLLEQSGLPYILASRSGALPDPSGIKTSRVVVKFDYFDPETYSNPFESLENTAQITAIWSFVPKCPDPEPIASRFIDFARSKGVERFVFIAGGNDRKGAPGFGKVWEKLSKDAEEGSVQYAVLVPSLFMGKRAKLKYQTALLTIDRQLQAPILASFLNSRRIQDLHSH